MANFPPSVGGEIPLKEAQERVQNFKAKYPDAPGTFNVPRGLIVQALKQSDEITGIKFGLGYTNNKKFAPIIGGSNLEGKVVDTFSNRGPIDRGEYDDCRKNWEADKPYDLNWVFMGRECLEEMVNAFPDGTIEACCDLSDEGLNICFIVSDAEGMKDDEGDKCAYNQGVSCPPVCN